MKSIEWKDWEIFCRVVEGGGFTRGAELADVPKSSASAAVSRLEADLHVRLFDRTTRRVRVTESGRRLYERVAPHFSALREIGAEAAAASRQVRGTLRIATPYEVGSTHLSDALLRLLKRHPGLRVQVDVTWEQPDLIKQGYDLVFVMTKAGLPDSSFASKRVLLAERNFYASPDLIRTHGLPRVPQDLANWPTVDDANETCWEFLRNGIETSRLPVQPRLATHNSELRLKAAVEGLGVARLSSRLAGNEVELGRLVRLLPDFSSSPLRVYVLMPARKLMPASVRTFLDALGETLSASEVRQGLAPGIRAGDSPDEVHRFVRDIPS